MPKFRKKPVVIEAVQYKGGMFGFHDVHAFVGNALIPYMLDPSSDDLMIETLEGNMRFKKGDFIIKGFNGEFYPCREDIFYKTYEAVEPTEQLQPLPVDPALLAQLPQEE